MSAYYQVVSVSVHTEQWLIASCLHFFIAVIVFVVDFGRITVVHFCENICTSEFIYRFY